MDINIEWSKLIFFTGAGTIYLLFIFWLGGFFLSTDPIGDEPLAVIGVISGYVLLMATRFIEI